jgi:hypothetical protein
VEVSAELNSRPLYTHGKSMRYQKNRESCSSQSLSWLWKNGKSLAAAGKYTDIHIYIYIYTHTEAWGSVVVKVLRY